MNSDAKRQALAVLAEIWELSPDVRLGQLFAHLGFLGETYFNRGLGDIEDDEMMSILCRHQAELLARLPPSACSVIGPACSPTSIDVPAPAQTSEGP